MKNCHHCGSALRGLTVMLGLLYILAFGGSPALADGTAPQDVHDNLGTGYSALKLFLQDERYLTIIRRTKAVLMFEGISESSKRLIDDISDTSAMALEQLEYMSSAKPAITFEEFPENSITITTLDAMRMTTARDLLFRNDDFEKSLLLSQAQILRVISHLVRQIEQREPNPKRRDWLGKLAGRYEEYYLKVYARITITKPAGA